MSKRSQKRNRTDGKKSDFGFI